MDDEFIPITGVWLHSVSVTNVRGTFNYVAVSIEVDGEWRRVVTELLSPPISHVIEVAGLRHAPRDDRLNSHR